MEVGDKKLHTSQLCYGFSFFILKNVYLVLVYMKFNLHAQLYNSYPVVHLPTALVLEHLVDGGQLSEILNPNLFQAD